MFSPAVVPCSSIVTACRIACRGILIDTGYQYIKFISPWGDGYRKKGDTPRRWTVSLRLEVQFVVLDDEFVGLCLLLRLVVLLV